MLKKLCGIFFVLIVLIFSARADIYHVATDGNDSTGDGSEGSPWATMLNAINEISAPGNWNDGDTIYIHPGTYTNECAGGVYDPYCNYGKYMYIMGIPDSTRPVFTGDASFCFTSEYSECCNPPHNFVLKNIVFDPVNTYTSHCINIYSPDPEDVMYRGCDSLQEAYVHNVVLDNCVFSTYGRHGSPTAIKMAGVDSFAVVNCYLIGWEEGTEDDATLGLQMDGCHYGVIFNNVMEEFTSHGFEFKGGCHDCIAMRNFLFYCKLGVGSTMDCTRYRESINSEVAVPEQEEPFYAAKDVWVWSNYVKHDYENLKCRMARDFIMFNNMVYYDSDSVGGKPNQLFSISAKGYDRCYDGYYSWGVYLTSPKDGIFANNLCYYDTVDSYYQNINFPDYLSDCPDGSGCGRSDSLAHTLHFWNNGFYAFNNPDDSWRNWTNEGRWNCVDTNGCDRNGYPSDDSGNKFGYDPNVAQYDLITDLGMTWLPDSAHRKIYLPTNSGVYADAGTLCTEMTDFVVPFYPGDEFVTIDTTFSDIFGTPFSNPPPVGPYEFGDDSPCSLSVSEIDFGIVDSCITPMGIKDSFSICYTDTVDSLKCVGTMVDSTEFLAIPNMGGFASDSIRLGPGDCDTFAIQFTTDVYGTYYDTVYFSCDSAYCDSIPIEGTCGTSCLPESMSIDFGTVEALETVKETLLVENDGCATFSAQAMIIDSVEFNIDETFPWDDWVQFDPADTDTIILEFTPGYYEDSLFTDALWFDKYFLYDDAGCGDSITLTGTSEFIPVCSLLTDTIDFDTLCQFSTVSNYENIYIENTGTGTLIDTAQSDSVSFSSGSQYIEADSTGIIDSVADFSITPADTGDFAYPVWFNECDTTWVVGYSWPEPVCSLSTTNYNFGDVEVGTHEDVTIEIYNVGSCSLSISGIDDFSPTPYYSIQEDCSAVLYKNEYDSVVVRFHSLSNGSHGTEFYICHQLVSLNGFGAGGSGQSSAIASIIRPPNIGYSKAVISSPGLRNVRGFFGCIPPKFLGLEAETFEHDLAGDDSVSGLISWHSWNDTYCEVEYWELGQGSDTAYSDTSNSHAVELPDLEGEDVGYGYVVRCKRLDDTTCTAHTAVDTFYTLCRRDAPVTNSCDASCGMLGPTLALSYEYRYEIQKVQCLFIRTAPVASETYQYGGKNGPGTNFNYNEIPTGENSCGSGMTCCYDIWQRAITVCGDTLGWHFTGNECMDCP